MISRRKNQIRIALTVLAGTLLFLWSAPSWSDGQIVKAGDEANVQFTCRLKSGDMVASSYSSVASDSRVRKSVIFVPRTADTPVPIVAGEPLRTSDPIPELGVEGEVVRQLSGVIVGLHVGEMQTRELTAAPMQEKKKSNYFVQIARVRQMAKEIRFTPDQYKFRAKKAAEVGQSFVIDPAVPGKVSSVTESGVVVRFSAHAGDKVETHFGEGTIKELPDHYEIVIDAHPGTLLLSGKFVGRITAVDDKLISIDYSNPFGSERLACDILVESVKPGSK
jgi:FKBP-type peptidyl-prolyl cis-trans isomerase 2